MYPNERELNANPQLDRDLTYMKCSSMALSPKEDSLIFTMNSNQIFKVPIALDSRNSEDLVRYDYLISGFHSHPIFGMDICLKKTIVATCSSDRTVRVWDYGK
jgi:WD40 repeat protein